MKSTKFLLFMGVLCLFITPMVHAQFTNIPDPQFEAYLVRNNIDSTPGDGRILDSEAATVTFLSYSVLTDPENITDITGIEAFVSLRIIQMQTIAINTYDLSNNQDLRDVTLNGGSSIILGTKSDLENLTITTSFITSLDTSGLSDLRNLILVSVPLNSIDLSNNTALETLTASRCQLTSLDTTNNPNLTILNLNNNNLTSLDLSANNLLRELSVSRNPFVNLDVSNRGFLEILNINDTFIPYMDLNTVVRLEEFYANNSSLKSINFDANSNMDIISIQNADLSNISILPISPMSSLDLTGNDPNLCIQVFNRNVTPPPAGWSKDASATYSSLCAPHITSISGFPSEITNQNTSYTITIQFSQPVTGFDDRITDIVRTNLGLVSQITQASGTIYQIDIVAAQACGTDTTFQIPAGAAQNGAIDNTASAVITVPTRDVFPPIVTFNSQINLNLGPSGTGTEADAQTRAIVGTPVDPSFCSSLNDLTIIYSPAVFDCSDVGNIVPMTVEVTDLAGNTTTGIVNVRVRDVEPPTAITQDITLQLNAAGQANIVPDDIDNGSFDNCLPIINKTLSKSNFTCVDLGPNTVTLTVDTGVQGQFASETAVVTVVDIVPTTAVCQDITVQLDANGSVTILPSDIDNGSGSGCDPVTLSLDQDTFTCANLGTNTVTLTADDGVTTDSCTATVTVEDNVVPIAITQDITVQLDGSGQASIGALDINNNSTDNCSVGTVNIDVFNFDCSNLGANTVTLSITDASGNTSTATATVTVEDNLAPIALAQDITVQLAANGQVTITGADVDNGSSDNCSVALSLSQSTFDCTDLGTNTVTLTATDPAGNTDTATAIVTVEDNAPLTAIAQDITVQLDANGQTTITPQDVDNGSGSGCGNVTLSLDITNFDCTNIGTPVTVTLTATEGPNTETATAIVTVEDTLPPTVVTQDITVQLDASGNATISTTDVDNGSSDNCAVSGTSLDITSFSCADLGQNTVTLTVTDNDGNSSTGTATVTVEDDIAPMANAQDITAQLDASGNAIFSASDIEISSSDNCGVVGRILSPGSLDCSNLGLNTVTFQVNDNSGNRSTPIDVTVTVEDNIAPVAIAQDITVELGANGSVTIAPTDLDNGSSDNCSVTFTADNTNFDCSNLGTNTVTLTVTDTAGNIDTATATVTVVDALAPVVVSQDISVTLDANGNASIVPADIDNGSSDNCTAMADLVYALDVNSFDCTDLGANTMTLTVTDASGNSDSGTATVTVIEDTPPVVITQDITVGLDDDGRASITAAQVNNGSTDDCSGIASVSLDITDFDCPALGVSTVTLTVTDNAGNSATGTATVNITATDDDNNGTADACENQELGVPQGFSPNGDGINDTWVIENIDDYPNIKVSVFNRWGVKVFESVGYDNDWDGTSIEGGGGDRLPAGAYLYVIETNDPEFAPRQGWIYLNY